MQTDPQAQRQKANLVHLEDIGVEAVVEVGRKNLKLKEVAALKTGAVIVLEKRAGEAFQVRVNQALVGEGEGVVVGRRMACRLTRLAGIQAEARIG